PKLGDHAKAPSILTFGGRLVQTHEPWHKEYAKAILLVRDCRDVVLSDYAWDESLDLIKHFDIRNFDDYLLPWLKGRVQTMGTWQDHTKSWLDSPLAKSENLLLVSFEEMRSNTEDMLAKMAQFLDVPVDRAIIRNVIANNTLDKMRAKEDASKR